MKKLIYLIITFIILNTFIFGVSNLFIKQKIGITENIIIKEHCLTSKHLEREIIEINTKLSLLYRYERGFGSHCDDENFRSVKHTFVYKDIKSKEILLNFIESSELKENLINKNKNNHFFLKNLSFDLFNVLNKYELKENKNEDLIYFKVNIRNLFSNFELIESENILKIKKISPIGGINQFSLKFSFFLTIYFFPIILLFIYMFRQKQLGFYRR
jgi:hypothetical protein